VVDADSTVVEDVAEKAVEAVAGRPVEAIGVCGQVAVERLHGVDAEPRRLSGLAWADADDPLRRDGQAVDERGGDVQARSAAAAARIESTIGA
jgi:hypothetical protein